MTCRLSNEQLQQQIRYHRTMASQGLTYTHSGKNLEEQSSFYSLTQTFLAEVYEELLERRLADGRAIENLTEMGRRDNPGLVAEDSNRAIGA